MGRKKVKCEEGITVPNPFRGLWRDPMEVFPLHASQIWRKRKNDPTGAVHLTGATVSEVQLALPSPLATSRKPAPSSTWVVSHWTVEGAQCGELSHSEPAHKHRSEAQSSVSFPISTAARKPQNRSCGVNMRGWKQVECHDNLALPPRLPQCWKSMPPPSAYKNTVVASDSPRGPSVASSRKPHGVITNWVQ